jgi:CRP/FNR family nitrogen fixation transcriptional regulator
MQEVRMTLTDWFHEAKPHRPAPLDSQDLLSRIGVPMAFAKDEEIYGQGEAADRIYRVVSGVVRTSRFMADGRRPIGAFYHAGEIFGVEQDDHHEMGAEALSNCVVLVLSREAFMAAGLEKELQTLVWEATLRDLESAREHLALLVRKNARERVASFLLGLEAKADDDLVDLAVGRQDMADYLGLTIETVSRMITQLQSAKIVEFPTYRQFRVRNRQMLEGMAAG